MLKFYHEFIEEKHTIIAYISTAGIERLDNAFNIQPEGVNIKAGSQFLKLSNG